MWNTSGGDRHAGRGSEKEMDRVASHPAVCRVAANADCVGPSKPLPSSLQPPQAGRGLPGQ